MRAEEVKGLMEAYSKVYESPEILEEEIVEEDVEQIDEIAVPLSGAAAERARAQNAAAARTIGNIGRSAVNAAQWAVNPAGAAAAAVGGEMQRATKAYQAAGPRSVKGAPLSSTRPAAAKPAAPAAPKPSAPAAAKPAAPSAPKPSAPAAAKPAAPSAPKPAVAPAAAAKPAAPAAPKGDAMSQWAAANPKLAAAKAERERTRGTSATTNPLMKDMKSSLPAPSTPSPSTATTGFNLAKKGVNLAADVDIFDLVVGHLLDEGYAETEQNAIVMMANMSEEWRDSILEAHGVDLEETKKWIQKAIKHPGSLSKQLGVPEEENIPMSKLKAAAKKGGTLGKRANLAMTLKGLNKDEE